MLGLGVYGGSGKVKAIRDKYVFDFPANADVNYALMHCLKPVLLKSVKLTAGGANFASYIVRKNSLEAYLPVELATNDCLSIELIGWNNNPVQFEISAEPVKSERTVKAVDLGGNGRYVFCLNYIDQTVSVIDTGITTGSVPNQTHPTTTTVLPAGHAFRSLAYRHIDKSVYVFGGGRFARIDADPDSGTFKNVVADVPKAGLISTTCCYDYEKDNFYVLNGSGNTAFRFNPNTQNFTNINSQYGINPARGTALAYVAPLGAVFIGDYGAGQIMLRTEDDAPVYGFGNIIMGQMVYNFVDGKIYHNLNLNIGRRTLNPLKLTQSVLNNYFRKGDIVIDPTSQLCFGTSSSDNIIGVVNIAGPTMVSLGSVVKGSPSANEYGSRGILYSPFSQRVYVQGSARLNQVTRVDRVHILNPAMPLAEMYAGYCAVGNMDASEFNEFGLHQMCLNQLKL